MKKQIAMFIMLLAGIFSLIQYDPGEVQTFSVVSCGLNSDKYLKTKMEVYNIPLNHNYS